MNLVFAVGIVLAVWAVAAWILCGIGALVLRAACGGACSRPGAMTACWTGLAATMVFLHLWHFALPIDARALSVMGLAGLFGWWRMPPNTVVSRREISEYVGLISLGVVVVLWLADRSIGPCMSFDSGNYHVPIVRWNRELPIVKGLANLSPFYGLSSGSLLLAALFEVGPLEGRSAHFVNGLFVTMLVGLLLGATRRLLRVGPSWVSSDVLSWALLLPGISLVLRDGGWWVATLSTDTPVAVAAMASAVFMLRAIEESPEDESGRRRCSLVAGLSLLAVIPTLKVTLGPYSAIAWVTTSVVAARRTSAKGTLLRPLVFSLVFALSACGAWIVRNTVTTGYPVYPVSGWAFGTDWQVPNENREGVAWFAMSYARTPEQWAAMTLGRTSEWLPLWFRSEFRKGIFDVLIPFALALSCLGVGLRRGLRPIGAQMALLLPVTAATLIWLLVAPAIRFGWVYFWLFAGQVAAGTLPALAMRPTTRRRIASTGVAVALVLPAAIGAHYAVKYRSDKGPWEAVWSLLLTPPGRDAGFHPLPKSPMKAQSICGGQLVLTPAVGLASSGETWQEALPWRAPLPATAMLLEGVCARGPEGVGAGFRVNTEGRSWAERNALRVTCLEKETNWPIGRLAVHFMVPPAKVQEALDLNVPCDHSIP